MPELVDRELAGNTLDPVVPRLRGKPEMTFVLNVLHNDYSLLAADRQADSVGPTTIHVGTMTVFAENGLTIHGFRKMKTSKCGTVAVGLSGYVSDHGYFDTFNEITGIRPALETILKSVQDFFLSEDRNPNLAAPKMMENQGIATFFDPVAAQYFSLIYIYTHRDTYTRWYNVASGSPQLVHVGTGSSKFQEAVGLDQINSFLDSIKHTADPRACLEWIKTAFEKVSVIAKGVGKEPEFLVSTPLDRVFGSIEAA